MAIHDLVLSNAEQKQYFRMLSGQKLPDFFGNLFEDPERALNFLHAFSKLRDEKSSDRWSGTEVLAQIRRQVINLTPDQLNALATLAAHKWADDKLDLGTTLAIALSSAPGDTNHAIAVMKTVNRAFLREDFYNLDGGDLTIVLLVIISSAAVTRTWSLLTEAVNKHVPEAEQVFTNFLLVMAVLQKYPRFVGQESEMYHVFQDSSGFQKLWEEWDKSINPWEGNNHRIPVMGEAAYVCNHLAKSLAEKEQAQRNKVQRLIAWFGAYEDDFQKLAAKMWDEIEADTKYGLKPTGDLVAIEVKDLRSNFWRYIQLMPGQDHMHLTARVWFYLPGDAGRISVLQSMSKSPLHRVAERSDEKSYDALCDKLQQFMALHSYWKIATGKVFKVRVKRTPSGERQREELERSFQVRPHYRWLPPDHHASERAIARSLAGPFQAPPPPGKTFVMSDPEQAAKPSLGPVDLDKPVIHYVDEDLGYATEEK